MPNRNTHATTGALVGTGWALAHQRAWLRPSDQALFTCGATTGGLIGGCLPDVFDPPCSPNHRQLAHALAPIGFFAVKTWAGMNQLIERMLAEADRENDPPLRLGMFFLAGVVKGAAPGYLSHLALDACTPRCLPLFGL